MAQKFDPTKFADAKIQEYDWHHEAYGYDNEFDEQEEMDIDTFCRKEEAKERAMLLAEKEKKSVVVYEKTIKEKEVTERKYVIGAEKDTEKAELRRGQKREEAQVKRCNWTDAFKPKMIVKETKKNKGIDR